MLYQPITLAPSGLALPNRVALAPMTNQQSHSDGTVSEEERRWLLYRAEGGFGMVVTCAANVSEWGRGWPGEMGVFSDALLPGLARLATDLRSVGSAPVVQIFHGGTRCPRELNGGRTPLSASDDLVQGVRGATLTEIDALVDDFAGAARRCEQAGFAGVEIHGANGYLFTQFLSRDTNRRGDEYGGTLENRARLLLRTVRAVRAAVSPRFAVGVRLSPESLLNTAGILLEESLEVAHWLAAENIDWLHLSMRDFGKHPNEFPQSTAVLTLFAERIRGRTALMVAGDIQTRRDADRALDLGATLVALGRVAILNPHWPRLARSGDFRLRKPPVSETEMAALAVSPPFRDYLRRWGFVKDERD